MSRRPRRPFAEIGRMVSQRKLNVTADTCPHVMADGREVNYEALLAAKSVGRLGRETRETCV
jgi:hypothetical protein